MMRAMWTRWTLAAVGSLLLHAALYLALRLTAMPALEVDLELEADLEFGASEAIIAVTPLETGPRLAPPPPPSMAPPPPSLVAPMPTATAETGFEPPVPGEAADAAAASLPDGGPPDAAPPPSDAAPPPPDAAPTADREDAPTSADAASSDATPAPDAAPPTPADAAPPDAAPPPADAAPPPPDAAPPPPDAAPPPADAAPPPPDAAGPVAAATDGGPPADGAPAPADAGPTGLAAAPPSGAVALPPGAQIALRLDLAAIRMSPLAEDVRALLASLWDWQQLLDGSGVDPVTALDRVLIAAPGLRRDRVVLAGALAGGDPLVVRRAVHNLAAARGTTAEWTVVDGRQVAPWANPDATKRHIALLGPQHFAIARLEDLPAVLALAQAREDARRLEQAEAAAAPDARGPPPQGATAASLPEARVTGPETLLWLPPGTVVSGEVDGARRLVRGSPPLAPERLRLALVSHPGERLQLEAEAAYTTREEAAAALAAVDAQRRQLASDPLTMITLRMLGLGDAVAGLVLEVREETHLYAAVELSHAQVRALLAHARTALADRAARRPSPRAPSSTPVERP